MLVTNQGVFYYSWQSGLLIVCFKKIPIGILIPIFGFIFKMLVPYYNAYLNPSSRFFVPLFFSFSWSRFSSCIPRISSLWICSLIQLLCYGSYIIYPLFFSLSLGLPFSWHKLVPIWQNFSFIFLFLLSFFLRVKFLIFISFHGQQSPYTFSLTQSLLCFFYRSFSCFSFI